LLLRVRGRRLQRHRGSKRSGRRPSPRDATACAADARSHDSMAIRERECQHRPEHGCRETVQRTAAGDGELEAVFVQCLRETNRLE
jgi:hypothetical protein